MKAFSNLAARDIIVHVAQSDDSLKSLLDQCFFFFFLNKSLCCFHGHTSSLPLSLRRHDESHKPTHRLNLITFAQGLNPNGLELNLYNLLGEFVRKGSVEVRTGCARRKFKSTQINPKGMRLH